jgi:hypothetical protein
MVFFMTINWTEFALNSPAKYEDVFDERTLYREIRRKKLVSRYKMLNKRYSLEVSYDPSVKLELYANILFKFFGVNEKKLPNYLSALQGIGKIEVGNLSTSVADLIASEISMYLSQNNINISILSKKVIDNALKKS